MNRMLIACLSMLAASQAAALQCAPMSQTMDEAPVVFIGRVDDLVRRQAVVAEEPVIMGAPRSYDLLRFTVVEPLKGDLPPKIELLCPTEDARCRLDDERRPLIVALPESPAGAGPQELICNIDYAKPRPNELGSDAGSVNALIERYRAARKDR